MEGRGIVGDARRAGAGARGRRDSRPGADRRGFDEEPARGWASPSAEPPSSRAAAGRAAAQTPARTESQRGRKVVAQRRGLAVRRTGQGRAAGRQAPGGMYRLGGDKRRRNKQANPPGQEQWDSPLILLGGGVLGSVGRGGRAPIVSAVPRERRRAARRRQQLVQDRRLLCWRSNATASLPRSFLRTRTPARPACNGK